MWIKYQFDAKLGYVCRWALCIWIQYRLSENKVIVTHLLGVQGPRDDVVWRLSSAYQLLIFTNLLMHYSSIVMIYIWWRLARCFVIFLHWHKVERGINILCNYGNNLVQLILCISIGASWEQGFSQQKHQEVSSYVHKPWIV
jgi:hypothetical protein